MRGILRTTIAAAALALLPAVAQARVEPGYEPEPEQGYEEREAYERSPYRDRRAQRYGIQLEGMIGGAGCMPGRAPCHYDRTLISGRTEPSFGVGATLGWRATRWLLLGGLYRLGMFDPDYVGRGVDYSFAAQHTVAALIRPILPIWRLDLGLSLAPGYSRQVFRYEGSSSRDYSQGFAMMVGPTIDVWLGRRFFLGAEIDFIFNTQRRVCRQRGESESCVVSPVRQVAPTHQTVFGVHLGGTFL